MSKTIKLSVLSIILMTVLSGCFPTGEESFSDLDPKEAEEEISRIAAENENLIIDLDLPEDVPKEVNKIKVCRKIWDTKLLDELFVKGVENIEPVEESKGEDGELLWCNYRNDSGYSVTYANGGRVWFDIGEPYASYAYFALSEGARAVVPLKDYFNDENAELFTRTQAVSRAENMLDDIGIGENLGEPFVYALTAEKANKYLAETYAGRLDKEGNEIVVPTWTANDEAYVVEYTMEFENVPLAAYSLPTALTGGSEVADPTYVTMVVRNDCVPLLWCEGIFDNEYEIVGKASISISPQAALKIVAERYAGLSIPKQITKICGCRLVYAPLEQTDENTFILAPFWEFSIRYDNGYEFDSISSTYVNAQTGAAL